MRYSTGITEKITDNIVEPTTGDLISPYKGTVSSKPQAAAWAQEAYAEWKPMIARALTWRTQHEQDDVTETLAFLRDVLRQAEQICEQE